MIGLSKIRGSVLDFQANKILLPFIKVLVFVRYSRFGYLDKVNN